MTGLFGRLFDPQKRFQAFDLKGDLFGGVTTAVISLPLALALENVVRQAQNAEVPVLVGGASGEVRKRLERLSQTSGSSLHFCETRQAALEQALEHI